MISMVNIYPTPQIFLIGLLKFGARDDLVASCYLIGRLI